MSFQTAPDADSPGIATNAWWGTTALKVLDMDVSVAFYERHFGMKALHTFAKGPRKMTFLVLPSPDIALPEANSAASAEWLWTAKVNFLILEFSSFQKLDTINNGNVEPHRGFGHIAFNCDDVYAATKKLEEEGLSFKKKPDEGRMKGIAFVLDPNGYWIELVKRTTPGKFATPFNFSQTMMRVKDPRKSLAFYRDLLGMRLVHRMPMSDFANFFLASIPPSETLPSDCEASEAAAFCFDLWQPVLELCHNFGTEDQPDFKYHSGATAPFGFTSVGFIVDKLEPIKAKLEEMKVPMQQGPKPTILFTEDPDGYQVIISQKGTVM